MTYDRAKLNDLDDIMNIEKTDFKPEEASSRETMAARIRMKDKSFILAKNDDGKIIGFICGSSSSNRHLSDSLFENIRPSRPEDKFQIVTSLAIHPDYQGLGLGKELLNRLSDLALQEKRIAISLTCLYELVPFYERQGYSNEGLSKSRLAGEDWYNMVKELN